MIQLLTKVKIIDNSGGVLGRCIKILKPHGRDYAKIGDIILVSILEIAKISEAKAEYSKKKGAGSGAQAGKENRIKKGTMFKALVVRTKSNVEKKTASFDMNAVVLLKAGAGAAQKKTKLSELPPIGTRVKGPISILLSPSYINAKNVQGQSGLDNSTLTKVTSLSSSTY
jgi:ribosomal protein L14